MKRNREELETELAFAITNTHVTRRSKEIKIIAETELKKYFYPQKIIQILNKNVPVSTLTQNELYNLALFLNKVNALKLDLSEYFHPEEMTAAINDTVTILRDYSRSVTFRDMKSNGNEVKEQFVGFLTYQEIAVMFEGGVFNYNFATQRKAKYVKIGTRVEKIATINNTNVQEIEAEVLKGKFEENTITLNIRPSKEEGYIYNPSTGDLTVDLTKTKIDTIDGYHRINGIYRAWLKNKNIKGSMILLIKNIDIPQARYFIGQEAKGTLNNKDDMELYDSTSNLAKLIYDINRYPNETNILFNRISDGNDTENALIYYDVFFQSMKLAWAEKLNETDIMELSCIKDFICEFYAFIYYWFKKKHKVDEIDDLKDTMLLDQMFMSGLLFPAHKMYESNNGIVDKDVVKKIADRLYNKLDDTRYSYNDKDNFSEFSEYVKVWEGVI